MKKCALFLVPAVVMLFVFTACRGEVAVVRTGWSMTGGAGNVRTDGWEYTASRINGNTRRDVEFSAEALANLYVDSNSTGSIQLTMTQGDTTGIFDFTGGFAGYVDTGAFEAGSIRLSLRFNDARDVNFSMRWAYGEPVISADGYELCGFCLDHYVHEDLRNQAQFLHVREPDELSRLLFPHLDEFESIEAAFLGGFSHAYYFSYLQFETESPSRMYIWPQEILRDFHFVSLGFRDDYENATLYAREVLLSLDEFVPGEVFVLDVAFIHYLLPRGGFIFTDENGSPHRMVIRESMRGGCWPMLFIAHADDDSSVWQGYAQ